nr:glycosyltransferase family 39 protein [bacterium]
MREKKKVVAGVLFLIFLAGLLVRIAGIGYDGLIPLNHDEQIHLKTARAFSAGELNPRAIWEGEIFRYAYYPWLSAYIFAGILAAVQAACGGAVSLAGAAAELMGIRGANGALVTVSSKCLLDPATALAVGRVAVALFGALTVLVLYRAGRDLMGRWGAALAAAFLAFNGYHIANCHWMKNDVIAAFFLTVAFFFCVRIWLKGRWSDYLLGAVFSVLAFNVKWYNAPVFGLFAVAHLLRAAVPDRRPAWKRLFPGRLFAAALLGAAVFVVTWPLLLFDPGFVFDNVARVSRDTSSRGMFGNVGTYAQLGFWEIRFHNLVNFVLFSSGMVSGMGWPVLLLGAAGLFAGLFSGRRGLLLAAFPVLYLVSAILVASPGIRYQDTIPLYPFFSLGAAWLVVRTAALAGRRRSWLIGGAIAAAILVPYLRSALRLDYGYWQNSVKYYAGRWAQRNIPPGSLIVKESKTIPLAPGRYREQKVRAFWGVPLEKLVKGGADYIITSGRQEHRALERFGL